MKKKQKLKNVGEFGLIPNLCPRFKNLKKKKERKEGRSGLDPLTLLIPSLPHTS
jgi:hypothetical protein